MTYSKAGPPKLQQPAEGVPFFKIRTPPITAPLPFFYIERFAIRRTLGMRGLQMVRAVAGVNKISCGRMAVFRGELPLHHGAEPQIMRREG